MRKLDPKIIAAVIFVTALGLYFFFKPMSTKMNWTEPAKVYGLKDAISEKASNDLSLAQSTNGTVVSADDSRAQSNESPEEKATRFKTWLSTESKNLDQPHVDTKQKDLELKKMIENFSDQEKQIVLNTVHDTGRPVNERILSAYLLVLDQSQTSVEHLNAAAKKALPDFGPLNAHSEAEVRHGQELAMRYMAADELAKRAQTDPQALDSLKNLARSGESAEIRGYAQRLLGEISGK
jgi:hypothetical protein